VPEGIAISDNFVGNKSFLDAVGPGSNSVEHAGVTLPWYAHATGEIFRVVSANLLHLSEGDAVCEGSPSQRCFSGPVCFGEARVQWAPQAEDFYR
jgi:hypothetical protein